MMAKKISKAALKRKIRHKENCIEKVRQRLHKSKHIASQRVKSTPSAAEQTIISFLTNNSLYFIPEYYTTHCFSNKTNNLLYFDFYLPDYKLVIEFDGMHHFKPIYGEEKLKQQKYKDRRKNKFCLKNGISILRIPYWESSNIDTFICRWFDTNYPLTL